MPDRIKRGEINEIWRATADEDGYYCFAARHALQSANLR